MNRWPDPPRLGASFYKAHGLGNDYVVFEEGDEWVATPSAVRLVCDPHRGIGSDGIVTLLHDRSEGIFRLRMFNPDGGEFERSGNGLRVLATHLARSGYGASPYRVSVGGEIVTLTVHGVEAGIWDGSVGMGRARAGPAAVALDAEVLDADGRFPGPSGDPLRCVPVSIGNPHMVVLVDEPEEAGLADIGPFLVGHAALAHGANVQLARALPDGSARALIWERGVGPTSASGTSACAVAVALVREGMLPPGEITVRMPGGSMTVSVTGDLDVVLRGPVEEVCVGALTRRFLERLGRTLG